MPPSAVNYLQMSTDNDLSSVYIATCGTKNEGEHIIEVYHTQQDAIQRVEQELQHVHRGNKYIRTGTDPITWERRSIFYTVQGYTVRSTFYTVQSYTVC